MTLKDDLTAIRGIGEAKAAEIIGLFDDYATAAANPPDGLEAAIRAAERGNEGEVIAFLESLRD